MTRASAGILGAQVLWTDQRGTLVRNLAGAAGLLALAGAICCLPFSQAALLIGAAIGGVLLLLRPTLGLYVLAFAVPFGSLREISLGGLSFGASELLVLATSGALLLRQVAARQVQLVGTPCSRAIWLFVGTLLLSFLPARELTPAIKELAKWVELLLVYTVVASATSRGEVRVLAGALLVAGLCEGLLGAWQFFRQAGPPGFLLMGRYMRAYGTFDQPNPYGGYLGLLLPLAYGLVLSGWRRGSEAVGRRTDWLLWILALVSGGGMLAGLVMSWSRGALLGLAAGLVLVVLVLGRRAWAFALVCVLVLALLGPGALTVLPQDLVGPPGRLDERGGHRRQLRRGGAGRPLAGRVAHVLGTALDRRRHRPVCRRLPVGVCAPVAGSAGPRTQLLLEHPGRRRTGRVGGLPIRDGDSARHLLGRRPPCDRLGERHRDRRPGHGGTPARPQRRG